MIYEAGNQLATLLNTAAIWAFNNPVDTYILLGLVTVGSFTLLIRRDELARSKAYRLFRGAMMKRKDREKYHSMVIEDAILDACMQMVVDGDMTAEEEKRRLSKMCRSYDLTGLMPGKDQASVKRGVNFRLLRGWWAKKPRIPGDPPGGPVDPNYKPEFEAARRGLATSKYAET